MKRERKQKEIERDKLRGREKDRHRERKNILSETEGDIKGDRETDW